jgi:hypothetical protein
MQLFMEIQDGHFRGAADLVWNDSLYFALCLIWTEPLSTIQYILRILIYISNPLGFEIGTVYKDSLPWNSTILKAPLSLGVSD